MMPFGLERCKGSKLLVDLFLPPNPPFLRKYEIMADLPNGKVCVASYHMWRLYPTRITTRYSICACAFVQTAMVC